MNPRDISHISFVNGRLMDAETISKHLASKNVDLTFWQNVKLGIQDPWAKLKANDVNKFIGQR